MYDLRPYQRPTSVRRRINIDLGTRRAIVLTTDTAAGGLREAKLDHHRPGDRGQDWPTYEGARRARGSGRFAVSLVGLGCRRCRQCRDGAEESLHDSLEGTNLQEHGRPGSPTVSVGFAYAQPLLDGRGAPIEASSSAIWRQSKRGGW